MTYRALITQRSAQHLNSTLAIHVKRTFAGNTHKSTQSLMSFSVLLLALSCRGLSTTVYSSSRRLCRHVQPGAHGECVGVGAGAELLPLQRPLRATHRIQRHEGDPTGGTVPSYQVSPRLPSPPSCFISSPCIGLFFPVLLTQFPNQHIDLHVHSTRPPLLSFLLSGTVSISGAFFADLHLNPIAQNPNMLARIGGVKAYCTVQNLTYLSRPLLS